MATIGSREAKTHRPALLDPVAKGDNIAITRRALPAAGPKAPLSRQQIVQGMRALHKRVKPGKMSLQDMFNEARRF
jgi:antitoxin (DNA-binding transcriptional repressor) of toxin-antitoxin stability system